MLSTSAPCRREAGPTWQEVVGQASAPRQDKPPAGRAWVPALVGGDLWASRAPRLGISLGSSFRPETLVGRGAVSVDVNPISRCVFWGQGFPSLFVPFLICEMGLIRTSTSKSSPRDRVVNTEHRSSHTASAGYTLTTVADAGSPPSGPSEAGEEVHASVLRFSLFLQGPVPPLALAISSPSGGDSTSCLPACLPC